MLMLHNKGSMTTLQMLSILKLRRIIIITGKKRVAEREYTWALNLIWVNSYQVQPLWSWRCHTFKPQGHRKDYFRNNNVNLHWKESGFDRKDLFMNILFVAGYRLQPCFLVTYISPVILFGKWVFSFNS